MRKGAETSDVLPILSMISDLAAKVLWFSDWSQSQAKNIILFFFNLRPFSYVCSLAGSALSHDAKPWVRSTCEKRYLASSIEQSRRHTDAALTRLIWL